MRIIKLILLLLFLVPNISFAGTARYLDCDLEGGSHNATGGAGTYASPYKSITDLNANKGSFSTGDDVYLKVNTTCTLISSAYQLNVTWSGTSGDHAIIGAYYGDGQFGLNGNDRPVIDGQWTYPSSTGETGAIHSTGQTHPYIEVKNLKIYRSGSFGMDIEQSYFTADNNISTYNNKAGIWVAGDYPTIQDNDISWNQYLDYPWRKTGGALTLAGAGWYPDGCTGAQVLRNRVHNNLGTESIGIGRKRTGDEIAFNVVYDNTSNVNIYLDAVQNAIVHHNLIYRSNSNDPSVTWRKAPGILVDNELYGGYIGCYTGGHLIYGNLIGNSSEGISIGSSEVTDCYQNDIKAYNNTIVDPSNNCFRIAPAGTYPGGDGGSGNEIKNNICMNYSSGVFTNKCGTTAYTWANNNSLSDPGTGACDDNGVFTNAYLAKTSDWGNLSPGEVIGEEFQLTAGTPTSVSSGGADLGTSLDYVLIPNTCDFTADPIVCTPDDADDYTWPIGAFLGSIPSIYNEYPTSQQSCPDDGVFGFTSSSNAHCKYSYTGEGDDCDTAYANLNHSMTTGEGGTSHEEDIGTPTCGTSVTYYAKCLDDSTSLESNCLEITIDVAASGGSPPQPAPPVGLDVSGGSVNFGPPL